MSCVTCWTCVAGPECLGRGKAACLAEPWHKSACTPGHQKLLIAFVGTAGVYGYKILLNSQHFIHMSAKQQQVWKHDQDVP